MNTLLIFPHQLFEENTLLKKIGKDDTVFLIQDARYFTDFSFHPLKIEFHTKSMKFYENYLLSKGYKVEVVEGIEKAFAGKNL